MPFQDWLLGGCSPWKPSSPPPSIILPQVPDPLFFLLFITIVDRTLPPSLRGRFTIPVPSRMAHLIGRSICKIIIAACYD
jgi:hypothetical protein